MVEKARLRGAYTDLLVGEMDLLLSTAAAAPPSSLNEAPFDLILATDTLVYYGDLHRIFQLVSSRLAAPASDGRPSLFAVSLELLPDEEACGEAPGGGSGSGIGWQLDHRGTYRHTARHVLEAADAAGMIVEHHDIGTAAASPRREGGEQVPGQLAILRLR